MRAEKVAPGKKTKDTGRKKDVLIKTGVVIDRAQMRDLIVCKSYCFVQI